MFLREIGLMRQRLYATPLLRQLTNSLMKTYHFIAFDLGATSGRAILGSINHGSLQTREISRFPNRIVHVGKHWYWNIYSLFDELKNALAIVAREGIEITSAGIDTWGVDVACIADDGTIAGLPPCYRDPYTDTWCKDYLENVMPRQEVYRRTGIQILNFNTLFQLHAMRRSGVSQLQAARHILFMPDALAYLLTGEKVTEYTIASTSQLLDASTRTFDEHLLASLGLDASRFGRMVEPGTTIGHISDEIVAETGIAPIPVIAVAGHDTASAVAAIPAADRNFAYLSSGTWSLMGIETDAPVINEETYRLNISNEGGAGKTIRLLKNITGMWLLEECLRRWRKEGIEYSYGQIVEMARQATPFARYIDPDDTAFAHPDDMPLAIAEYCRRTAQTQPESHADFIRCIFESLALKYRAVLEMFGRLAPFPIERLHVIGGGSRNALLSQMTADAIGIPVIAGPAEATAIGNIMLQAAAAGMAGSLPEMRRVIAASINTEQYLPHDKASWDEAYRQFLQITHINL